MELEVTEIERVFMYNDTVLSDPDPSLTPEEVLVFYSNTYPALTTSNVHGELNERGIMEYTFKTTIGTKG